MKHHFPTSLCFPLSENGAGFCPSRACQVSPTNSRFIAGFKTCGTSCGTPWKFNSSHLKICHPKRKGSSFNHHFSVAMLNLGGAEHVAFGIAGHSTNESDVATEQ